jgi:hypothetical protein
MRPVRAISRKDPPHVLDSGAAVGNPQRLYAELFPELKEEMR